MLGTNKSFTKEELFEIEHGEHAFDNKFDNPALYVGTYGKYNDGNLFGMWIDLTTFSDYDEFIVFCKLLHKDERDPELMFQDYMNFPEAWYSESGIDEETFDKIREYSDKDDYDREMWEKYMEYNGECSFDTAQDKYMGQYDSEEDFAEEFVLTECPELSDFAKQYFDYVRYARDLFIDSFDWLDGYVFQKY